MAILKKYASSQLQIEVNIATGNQYNYLTHEWDLRPACFPASPAFLASDWLNPPGPGNQQRVKQG